LNAINLLQSPDPPASGCIPGQQFDEGSLQPARANVHPDFEFHAHAVHELRAGLEFGDVKE
jgi:hypothetical protein